MGEKTREPNYIIEISEPARVQKVQGQKFLVNDIAVCILSMSLVTFSVISSAVYLGGRGLLVLRIILFILSFLLLFLIHPVTKPMPTDLCFYDNVLLLQYLCRKHDTDYRFGPGQHKLQVQRYFHRES